MCLPVTTILADLYKYADVEATTSLLAKMGKPRLHPRPSR